LAHFSGNNRGPAGGPRWAQDFHSTEGTSGSFQVAFFVVCVFSVTNPPTVTVRFNSGPMIIRVVTRFFDHWKRKANSFFVWVYGGVLFWRCSPPFSSQVLYSTIDVLVRLASWHGTLQNSALPVECFTAAHESRPRRSRLPLHCRFLGQPKLVPARATSATVPGFLAFFFPVYSCDKNQDPGFSCPFSLGLIAPLFLP